MFLGHIMRCACGFGLVFGVKEMAEEDYAVSELKFRGQLGLMTSVYDLKGRLVDNGVISKVISRNTKIIPGVHTIVCEFSGADTKNVVSHDFGVLSFEYFIGLGTNFLSYWKPGYDSYERDKWEEMVSEIKRLPSTLVESFEKDNCQRSTSTCSIPKSKVQLPQSLIRASEFLGPEFLEWLQGAPLKKCPICDELLKPGEDVSTLVNMKTRKLACSTGINNGVYHVCHTCCLISWILLFDFMIECGKRAKKVEQGMMIEQGLPKKVDQVVMIEKLHSVVCPECQGSDGKIRWQRPRIPLDRIATLKKKACYSYKEWLESQDEGSDKRAIGLSFPILPNDGGKVEIRKRLHIYKAY